MRIIGGEVKGRRLLCPKGGAVRPTADKVREALFDILGEKIAEAEFLDLYAGTGGVGIEALSRGATAVTLVEQNPQAVRFINTNLSHCGFAERAELIASSANKAIPRLAAGGKRFDIVFADPPYKGASIQESLRVLVDYDILKTNSLVIVEHDFRYSPAPQMGKLALYRKYRYGHTILSFYAQV
jgi:16S rRNA (guanine966-N2)-methyltransferase